MFKYKFSFDYVEVNKPGTRLQEGEIFKQEQPSDVGLGKNGICSQLK